MRVEIADNLLKRALGLMFSKEKIMIFILNREEKQAIWTPFMRFDVDLFFFSKSKRLTEKVSLEKWRIYKPKKAYKYLIEAPKGKLTKRKAISLIR